METVNATLFPINPLYFDRQCRAHCGMHAVNNLLGYNATYNDFGSPNVSVKAEIEPLTLTANYLLNMAWVCERNIALTVETLGDAHTACQSEGNYDEHDIFFAVFLLGLASDECTHYLVHGETTDFRFTRDPTLLGYIINYSNRHWYSIRVSQHTVSGYPLKFQLVDSTMNISEEFDAAQIRQKILDHAKQRYFFGHITVYCITIPGPFDFRYLDAKNWPSDVEHEIIYVRNLISVHTRKRWLTQQSEIHHPAQPLVLF